MDLNRLKMAVVGGDHRSLLLAKMFANDGRDVSLFGLGVDGESASLQEAIAEADIIIGPLPFANKAGKLNTPNFDGHISIEKLIESMKSEQLLLGGYIHETWRQLASSYNVQCIDYFAEEALQIANAIPTAEGALQIALEKLDRTVHGAHVLVVGYGRIGKAVAHLFQGMGANVTIAARNKAQLAWGKVYHDRTVHTKDMGSVLPKMDLVINTVPAVLLHRALLEELPKSSVLIDVASAPGGIDFEAAKQLRLEAVLALGLPGKVAPVTAAEGMKETIESLLENVEV